MANFFKVKKVSDLVKLESSNVKKNSSFSKASINIYSLRAFGFVFCHKQSHRSQSFLTVLNAQNRISLTARLCTHPLTPKSESESLRQSPSSPLDISSCTPSLAFRNLGTGQLSMSSLALNQNRYFRGRTITNYSLLEFSFSKKVVLH